MPRLLSVCLTAITLLSACQSPGQAAATLVERSHTTMGSLLRVAAWTDDEAATVAAFERVFREFDRLEALLSVWKDGSDVLRLNAAAGGGPVTVSADTIEVLEAAHRASGLTGGKFDITFGALADIWKFDHDQDGSVPTRAAIAARVPFVDYTAVRVDRAAGTASIDRKGVRVHLGGIGKGYAVDRAAAILRGARLQHFLIQSGGDLYVSGSNGGVPWELGIADPRGDHAPFATVQMSDGTFSTSGDYERSFIKDGVRYHHLIDPDAGEPARGARSVTIIANRAIDADVLSTGVFIMGPTAGMALVERLPDVEAVIVTAENQLLVSSGLRGRLHLRAPPTDAP